MIRKLCKYDVVFNRHLTPLKKLSNRQAFWKCRRRISPCHANLSPIPCYLPGKRRLCRDEIRVNKIYRPNIFPPPRIFPPLHPKLLYSEFHYTPIFVHKSLNCDLWTWLRNENELEEHWKQRNTSFEQWGYNVVRPRLTPFPSTRNTLSGDPQVPFVARLSSGHLGSCYEIVTIRVESTYRLQLEPILVCREAKFENTMVLYILWGNCNHFLFEYIFRVKSQFFSISFWKCYNYTTWFQL